MKTMSKKYLIHTFGCQMNDLDSEKIAGNLRRHGMEAAENAAQADIIILNTCSVREKAVQKVYARLGEIGRQKRRRPNLRVGIVGCMAQLEREKILKGINISPLEKLKALRLMNEVFQADTANWRGIGSIPESGLRISDRYASFDAARAFPVNLEPAREPQGCICGDVLRGVATPPQCKLFGRACIPERPVGPCMVSSEGACAAYYQFADVESIEAGS